MRPRLNYHRTLTYAFIPRFEASIRFCTPLSTLLFAIAIVVAPVPVGGLLSRVQLDESVLLMVIGLVALVRAVFISVQGVIVLAYGHP